MKQKVKFLFNVFLSSVHQQYSIKCIHSNLFSSAPTPSSVSAFPTTQNTNTNCDRIVVITLPVPELGHFSSKLSHEHIDFVI